MNRPKRLHPQLQREKDAADINDFLDDLRKVYIKHNLIVGACGCCDSPFIVRPERGGVLSALTHLVSDVILENEDLAV